MLRCLSLGAEDPILKSGGRILLARRVPATHYQHLAIPGILCVVIIAAMIVAVRFFEIFGLLD